MVYKAALEEPLCTQTKFTRSAKTRQWRKLVPLPLIQRLVVAACGLYDFACIRVLVDLYLTGFAAAGF